MLLALGCSACVTSSASHHGATAATHKRSAGLVRIHTLFQDGPLDPKTHRGVLDNKPVGDVRLYVVSGDGRHWYGRTSSAGTRTFKLAPGRYLVGSDWCGPRRTQIKVLPERMVPVRYACPLR